MVGSVACRIDYSRSKGWLYAATLLCEAAEPSDLNYVFRGCYPGNLHGSLAASQ
jgi:hypothetical protein